MRAGAKAAAAATVVAAEARQPRKCTGGSDDNGGKGEQETQRRRRVWRRGAKKTRRWRRPMRAGTNAALSLTSQLPIKCASPFNNARSAPLLGMTWDAQGALARNLPLLQMLSPLIRFPMSHLAWGVSDMNRIGGGSGGCAAKPARRGGEARAQW